MNFYFFVCFWFCRHFMLYSLLSLSQCIQSLTHATSATCAFFRFFLFARQSYWKIYKFHFESRHTVIKAMLDDCFDSVPYVIHIQKKNCDDENKCTFLGRIYFHLEWWIQVFINMNGLWNWSIYSQNVRIGQNILKCLRLGICQWNCTFGLHNEATVLL